MKKNLIPHLSLALLLTALPAMSQTTTNFFVDNFTGASTLTNATPAQPTASSAGYQLISTKAWTPAPTLVAHNFTYGLPSTTGGTIESQALFTTNPVALTQSGDYIQLTVTFVNASNLLTAAGMMGFGLYNSGQTNPIAGGLDNLAINTSPAQGGGTINWQGYVGQVSFNGTASRILTRAAQTSTIANNQDLVTTGSGSESYSNPGGAAVGTAVTSTLVLVNGATYTEVLTIALNGTSSLAITNSLYNGVNTNAPLLTQYGGIATNATFLTAGFDALGIGWLAKAATTGGTIIDINSIQVSGQSTIVSSPPTITAEPVPVVVTSGGAADFTVAAQGFNVTYQWKKNGVALLNGGNISGATTSMLVISPSGAGDVATSVNGYSVTVSGAGGFSTNSFTNSLSLVPATNLIWTAAGGATWDLNNTVSWQDSLSNPHTFNFGDPVTFDDTASSTFVTLVGNFLSAGSMTVNSPSGQTYSFSGTGSFAGPGSLIYTGTGQLTLNNANTYSGGTLVSNEVSPGVLYVFLENYNGLGTGPVVLDNAGGTMETTVSGSATVGFNGGINVLNDFKIQVDGVGTFATVFLGNLSGTSGKTLTITPETPGTTNRFRIYGTNTVYNGNLILDNLDSPVSQAIYNGTVLAPYLPNGTQTYNGVISGVGGIAQRGNGMTILNGLNTYSGGTFTTAGAIAFGIDSSPTSGTVTSGPIGTGPLFLAPEIGTAAGGGGSGMVLAFGGAHTIANPIEFPSSTNNLTLIVGGANNLTFTGPFGLNGVDGAAGVTNRMVQVTNTALTTFSGVISDGGAGFGLIKSGAGVMALNNTETYAGPTIDTNGTLLVNGQLNSASTVSVYTNATLGGTGTINGAVTINAGGILAPGAASIGTLSINNSLTLAGNVNVRVNRAGSSSDQASVTGTLANTGTGTVTITNLGTTLQPGDTFALFNKAVTTGNTLTVTGAGVIWTNKLALNGTIAVVGTISTVPAPITVTVSGNVLTLSWPPDHQGWSLEAQTNTLAKGLGTNWVKVPGTASVISTNITANTSNAAVFYRLISP